MATLAYPRIRRARFYVLCALVLAATVMPPRDADVADAAPAAQASAVIRDTRFGLNQAWEAPDAADRAGGAAPRRGGGCSVLLLWRTAPGGGAEGVHPPATPHLVQYGDRGGGGGRGGGAKKHPAGGGGPEAAPHAAPLNLLCGAGRVG